MYTCRDQAAGYVRMWSIWWVVFLSYVVRMSPLTCELQWRIRARAGGLWIRWPSAYCGWSAAGRVWEMETESCGSSLSLASSPLQVHWVECENTKSSSRNASVPGSSLSRAQPSSLFAIPHFVIASGHTSLFGDFKQVWELDQQVDYKMN